VTRQRALSALPAGRAIPRRERAPEAVAIERDFPGWHVWISSLDRWWAVRQGPDAQHDRNDPRPMTIDADDPLGLREQLATICGDDSNG
jgi:hypothetical protein